jgi:hypothetical protein
MSSEVEIAPATGVDRDVASAFLNELFPAGATGFVNLWTRDGKRSHWYGVDDLVRAADDLATLNATGCVWFQTGLIPVVKGENKRGAASEVIGYPGLHADVDVWDAENPDAHKSAGPSDLPPDLPAALRLLAELSLFPTIVVSTGHGVQPHWLFTSPVVTDTSELRDRVKAVQAGLQAILRAKAADKGWKLDSTPDLVRLLRIPGTVNRKPGCVPVPVMVISDGGPRYAFADLERWVQRRLPAVLPNVPEDGDILFTDDVATADTIPPPVAAGSVTPTVTDAHSDDDVLKMAGNLATNGEKFRNLWGGLQDGYKSPSEAMQALLSHLAFYTRDIAQIERLAYRSKLTNGYAKWHDRADYRARSINTALATVKPSDWAMGKPSGEKDENENENEKGSQAARLLRLASSCDYWHDPERRAYATVNLTGGGIANYMVESGDFRDWLSSSFFKSEGRSHSGAALDEAVGALTARARFDGDEHPVHIRVAGHGGAVYIDLGCPAWRAVEVTGRGWRVVDSVPVKFTRRRGMLALPVPVEGGSLADLRGLLNATDEGFTMMLSWLIGAFRPSGSYPILSISGEQGSAKSTTCRLLRRLVDPHVADVAQPPKSDHDLMVAASNGWVYSIDNLSGLSGDTSDTLCRLATGAAWRSRQLYSDGDEHILRVCRPVIVNGIGEMSSRADLAERSLLVHLPAIPASQRRTEADVGSEFARLSAGLLGALLTAVSAGLRNADAVKLDNLPRMADFARWVVAAESSLPWTAGTFMQVYTMNQTEGRAAALDADPVAGALLRFLDEWHGEWDGYVGGLHALLTAREFPFNARSNKSWPRTAAVFSTALTRITPSLVTVAGVTVTIGGRTKHGVPVRLHRDGEHDATWSRAA